MDESLGEIAGESALEKAGHGEKDGGLLGTAAGIIEPAGALVDGVLQAQDGARAVESLPARLRGEMPNEDVELHHHRQLLGEGLLAFARHPEPLYRPGRA